VIDFVALAGFSPQEFLVVTMHPRAALNDRPSETVLSDLKIAKRDVFVVEPRL
jgi:hypothetical protein